MISSSVLVEVKSNILGISDDCNLSVSEQKRLLGISVSRILESPTGIRIATWPRDRLGYFSPAPGVETPHFISCPLRLDKQDARVYAVYIS